MEQKLNASLSLKICLIKTDWALDKYRKNGLKKRGYKKYLGKEKLKRAGFSLEEINHIFHPELTKTNRY